VIPSVLNYIFPLFHKCPPCPAQIVLTDCDFFLFAPLLLAQVRLDFCPPHFLSFLVYSWSRLFGPFLPPLVGLDSSVMPPPESSLESIAVFELASLSPGLLKSFCLFRKRKLVVLTGINGAGSSFVFRTWQGSQSSPFLGSNSTRVRRDPTLLFPAPASFSSFFYERFFPFLSTGVLRSEHRFP